LRLVDVGFPAQMAEYAMYAVLHFQRRMGDIEALQRQARWNQLDPFLRPPLSGRRDGAGRHRAVVAQRFAAAGYAVAGWTRAPNRSMASTVREAQTSSTLSRLGVMRQRIDYDARERDS